MLICNQNTFWLQISGVPILVDFYWEVNSMQNRLGIRYISHMYICTSVGRAGLGRERAIVLIINLGWWQRGKEDFYLGH